MPEPQASPAGTPEPARPANRAARRAAARGRSVVGSSDVPAPRRAAPREQTKPVHVRPDFVARRGG